MSPPDLIQRFLRQVRRTPHALAVTGTGGDLTYGLLEARSAAVAAALREEARGRPRMVGLACGRTTASIVAVMGVLRAGAAYVPLDESHPAEYNRRLMRRAGVRQVIADRSTADAARALTGRPLTLRDDGRPDGAGAPDGSVASPAAVASPASVPPSASFPPPARTAAPEAPAYILFTSGSTGEPKGVIMPRRSLDNLVDWLLADPDADLSGPVLHFSTLSWDTSTQEIFPTLCAGSTVVVATQEERHDPRALLAALRAHRVGRAVLPPQILHRLVGAGQAPQLREVMSGGDQLLLTPELRDWCAAIPARRLRNAYGPTETQIATVHTVPDVRRAPAVVPLGGPAASCALAVLGPDGSPVPDGVPGELHIGGPGLADGYLGAPRETAARFLPAPGGPAATRRYRSGDLVVREPNGALRFVGRADRQVKIRGHRVEPQQTEAVLAAMPGIGAAAVIAAPGPAGPRLVAFLVRDGADGPVPESDAPGGGGHAELRAALAERLPPHQVPVLLRDVPELPLTANGKADVARLRELAAATTENGHSTVPGPSSPPSSSSPASPASPSAGPSHPASPSGPAERTLREIFTDCLGLPALAAPDADLLVLGGDSLTAMDVAQRFRAAGYDLPVSAVLAHTTPRRLAALVRSPRPRPAPDGAVSAWFPLAPSQADGLSLPTPDRDHHNQYAVLRTAPGTDPARLSLALAAVVRTHPSLRLSVREDTGAPGAEGPGPRQRVTPAEAVPGAALMDVTDLPPDAGPAEVAEAVRHTGSALHRSLDLAGGRLLRARLLRRGAHRTGRLLLVAHQMGIDRLSWSIVAADLAAAYDSGSPRLEPEGTSLREWIAAVERHAHGAAAAEAAYWRQQGEPTGPLRPDVPGADPLRDNLAGSAAEVVRTIGGEVAGALLRRTPGPPAEMLLYALGRVLAGASGTRAVRIDTLHHGRGHTLADDVDLLRTTGWFTASVPVRVDTADGLAAFLRRPRPPHGGLGWGALRTYGSSPAATALGLLPSAEVSFDFLGRPGPLGSTGPFLGWIPEADTGPFVHGEWRRPHPLEVQCEIAGTGDRLTVTWTYSRAVFRAATVRGWAEEHVRTVTGLVA
ncbi:amino acid adenylation domain-containing protein [Streptomyces sp. NPDC054796]